jgi:glycosyltransferase involved in cell wall biosynthesis
MQALDPLKVGAELQPRRKIRMAHLVSHPVQYLVPIYREISRDPNIDLTVYFYSDESLGKHYDEDFHSEFEWSTPLLGGYKHEFLPSSKGKPTNRLLDWPNWDILGEVFRQRYDVLWVNSYIGTNAWIARFAAMWSRTPIFFRDDTNLLTPRPLWKRIVKNIFLRNFLRGTGALYVGQESKRYWTFYGIPSRRQFFSPHCVDNEYWSSKYRELAPQRAEIRKRFGILDDAPVILFCAKFIPKKQPLLMLKAFAKVREQTPCWLLMVGDGPLRGDVERTIREMGIENVVLPGFQNQDELPLAYTAADVFVLPSAFNETWGLVVNEAMNFALPIVVSDRVGCSKDLVRDGWNGFTVSYVDETELAARLKELVSSPELRATFGRNSAELIKQYTVKSCASGIVQAGCSSTSVVT